MNKIRPMLTLGAMSLFFAELLSGNIPFPAIFQPLVLLLLVVAYSLPVIVIRDLAVRWNLGLMSVAILGLAYGIYNEGIAAKTLLAANGPTPLPAFTDYAIFGGINFSWLVCILIWHALNSVLFPIVIVSAFWPEELGRVWLGAKTSGALLLISLALGILFYFKNPPLNLSVIYLFLSLAAIALLVFLARHFRNVAPLSDQPTSGHRRMFLLGAATVIFYAVVQPLAAARAPFLIYLAAAGTIVGTFLYLLRQKERNAVFSMSYFGIGSYSVAVLIRACGPSKSPYPFEPRLIGAVFAVLLLIFAVKLRRGESKRRQRLRALADG